MQPTGIVKYHRSDDAIFNFIGGSAAEKLLAISLSTEPNHPASVNTIIQIAEEIIGRTIGRSVEGFRSMNYRRTFRITLRREARNG